MQQETPDALKFFANYMIPNPEEFAGNLLKAYEIGSQALARLTERPDTTSGPYSPASELSAASQTHIRAVPALALRPGEFGRHPGRGLPPVRRALE